MSDNQSNNKRIAKNSIFMAIRMVFVLVITFYTTRVILNILGVEDYGVYNVVCGFVSMFAFLNTSMSNGIQRFYNFELGKNGNEGATKVYNTALLIQLILAIIIIILTESFGLWYLHSKMVIPEGRMYAAEWIFQFSVLSFLFIIMQAPYTAAVMAHERMDFYAIVSVLDAVLKLGIVFAIQLIPDDRLVVYGLLFALISILNFVLYYAYCKHYFPEIKTKRVFEKQLFRSMLGFSGWNIFGSFAHMMKEQGINLVMNLFYGPIVNAARGIAVQVSSGLQNFVTNITVPVRPQVVQSYAAGDITRTLNLTYSVSKISCYFLYMMSLPILLEIDYILTLWLGNNIPEHSANFVIIIVVTAFINNLNGAISGVVHASGKMRKYQLYSTAAVLLSIPLAYFCLKLGGIPELALIMALVSMVLAQAVALIVLKSIVEQFSIVEYLKFVIFPIIVVMAISLPLPWIIHHFMSFGFLRLLIVGIVSEVMAAVMILAFGLNSSEKNMVKTASVTIKKRIKH